MKHEIQKNSCSPTKGIVLTRYSLVDLFTHTLFVSLVVVPFSKVCQIGRRCVTEALGFFQNAFQHDSRLSCAVTLWAGNNMGRGRKREERAREQDARQERSAVAATLQDS